MSEQEKPSRCSGQPTPREEEAIWKRWWVTSDGSLAISWQTEMSMKVVVKNGRMNMMKVEFHWYLRAPEWASVPRLEGSELLQSGNWARLARARGLSNDNKQCNLVSDRVAERPRDRWESVSSKLSRARRTTTRRCFNLSERGRGYAGLSHRWEDITLGIAVQTSVAGWIKPSRSVGWKAVKKHIGWSRPPEGTVENKIV